MTRSTLVVANWKMHGQINTSGELLAELKGSLTGLQSTVVICPPALYIPLASESLSGSALVVGAQNAYQKDEGAFTGEISAHMLKDFDCQYVLVGHSERRELFGETDDIVVQKFAAIQAQSMRPILCIGESLSQREKGQTEDVVLEQLAAVVDALSIDVFTDAVVAYEPIWAIGTGLTATPDQAQAVHKIIRSYLAEKSQEIAKEVPLLYGGSVKAESAADLFSQADIDGGLVGGASLKAKEFELICQAADRQLKV